jgi:ribosome-binding protein aMBF1 (putative translation factor)
MTRHEPRHGEADPVKLIIAARIRDAQEELGLKTEDLAHEIGISLRLVQKHRAGDNAPGNANLRRYAAVLKKPMSFFFTGEPLKKAAA